MPNFNPSQFKGKKQIYQKLKHQIGIYSIWDWTDSKGKYQRRSRGLQYYAIKKINKKQYSKSFEKLQEAKNWRSSSGYEDKSSIEALTFEELLTKFFESKEGKVTKQTLETYESQTRHLKPFFNHMKVKEINPRVIDQWLIKVKKKDYLELQNSTRLTYKEEMSLLRNVLNFYGEYLCDNYHCPVKKRHLKDCIIDISKYKQKKEENLKRFLNGEEVTQFLIELKSKADKNPKDFIYFCIGAFQFFSGCRIGEVCAISWSDINFKDQTVQINKSVQWGRGKSKQFYIQNFTKNGESRVIYLPPMVLEILSIWKEMQKNSSEGLVFSPNGFSIVSYRNVQSSYNKALKAIGSSFRSTHLARHSFATNFLEQTGNQIALSKLLGHKSIKQTEHYAKRTSKVAQDAYNTFQNSIEESCQNILPFKKGLGEAG